MRKIVLCITFLVITLIFTISAYSHEYTSSDFWQHGTKWYDIDSSSSPNVESAQFRYLFLDYSDSTDTCLGLNFIINDKSKISQTALNNVGFDVSFFNTSGECLDYFHVLAREGVKQEKGANGTFAASCEGFNSNKGSNYRFFAEYHSLNKFAQSDKIIAKIQLFDSQSFAVIPKGNEITITVPRLSLEPTTSQKAAKSQKSKKSAKKSSGKSKKSSKSESDKKKKYYSSTTAARYNSNYSGKSKSYYSSGKNTKSKVSTTKAQSAGDEENENYNKADIVELEENDSAMNTKQVIAVSVISVLCGCLIAIIILLIINKNKHKSSTDDNKQ